jgi:predicted O-methyltransferase YrrM
MSSVFTHFVKWFVGIDRASTQTTEAERACMARYADERTRLAEIGVWEGVTAAQLRSIMADDGIYFAIDPYPIGRLGFSTQRVIAHGVVGKVRRGSVTWLRSKGVDAAKEKCVVEKPIDFLFIDGDHSYEGLKADWEAWRSLVAIGGVVALHDSRSSNSRNIDNAGSVRCTNEIILREPGYTVVETVDSLTVLKRTL